MPGTTLAAPSLDYNLYPITYTIYPITYARYHLAAPSLDYTWKLAALLQ